MNRKLIISLISVFLICLCSCRELLVENTIWVAECEHGTLTVEPSDASYDFIITATPDKGYCLLESNLYIREVKEDEARIYITSYSIAENKYGFYTSSTEKNIVVSAVFTKVEE